MSKLRYTVLSRGAKRPSTGSCNNSTPVKWSKYYEKQQYIRVEHDTFNIYIAGESGPVLLLIHGGGYSALTWALFAEEIIRKVECQVLAVDLRGHGNTKTADDGNLALDVLAEDISKVIDKLYDGNAPPIVIVGHSLGGAVAVAVASRVTAVIGLCVIDVVEGTAIESLSSMQNILRSRPTGFKSIEHAIQWSYRGGQTHNLEAARVSMPGQIKSLTTGNLAANEEESCNFENGSISEKKPHIPKSICQNFTILEEETVNGQPETCDTHNGEDNFIEEPSLPPPLSTSIKLQENNMYTWRIDLAKTEPFWTGWFKGLSQKFLDVPVPKVLLLANINGLDTTLTVGQMQGKFQFQVLQKSGHAIHEDQPQRVADIIATFLVKQKMAISKKGFTPIMPAC